MTAETVYASAGGRRYHATTDCRVFRNGHGMWRFDPNEWVPGMPQVMLTDGHPLRKTTALAAIGAGKTPCHVCIPGSERALAVSSCEDDFGHEPRWIGETGYCPRCSWDTDSVIDWPCSSAAVLGLVERVGATAP